MGLRSGSQSCMDTSSQIPISSVIILGWRKLPSYRKHTKQPCLVGRHFISALEGVNAIQNSPLKELTYLTWPVMQKVVLAKLSPPPDHFWLPKLVRGQILASKTGPPRTTFGSNMICYKLSKIFLKPKVVLPCQKWSWGWTSFGC